MEQLCPEPRCFERAVEPFQQDLHMLKLFSRLRGRGRLELFLAGCFRHEGAEPLQDIALFGPRRTYHHRPMPTKLCQIEAPRNDSRLPLADACRGDTVRPSHNCPGRPRAEACQCRKDVLYVVRFPGQRITGQDPLPRFAVATASQPDPYPRIP